MKSSSASTLIDLHGPVLVLFLGEGMAKPKINPNAAPIAMPKPILFHDVPNIMPSPKKKEGRSQVAFSSGKILARFSICYTFPFFQHCSINRSIAEMEVLDRKKLIGARRRL